MGREIRVSPDGASCPDTDCDCDCHHKANLKKGKGKGKGKSSKPKVVCERGQDGIMVCCCGKKPEPEEIIMITPEPEVVEPEILIETCDIEIQVDVKELKNNVSDVKPKRPRFVSVYLEAPDENTPRYMLAKNIHHKDRTQYTYIENKPHTTGEHWETSVNNKHTVQHRGNSSSNDPHVTSASTIIQVKESDSAHDFSDRDVIEDSNPGDISIDCILNDGSKWNRGVDTEDLATDDLVNEFASSPQPEQYSTQDIHNHEVSTNDSGIENIDLDSVSEVETQSQPSGKREIRRPVYVKPEVVYDSGTPGAISKVHHIPVEKVKGEPVVPKNRGTIIDYTKRLKEIKRIYDPYGIDLDKVKVNKQGDLVYMRGSKSRSDSRETPQTRTEFLETSMSIIRNSPILENENTQSSDSDNDTGQIDQKAIEKSHRSTSRNSVASSINQDPNSIEVVSPANSNDSPSSDSRNSNHNQNSGQQDDESREQVTHSQIDDESPISNEKDHFGDPEISKAEDTPTDTAHGPLSCPEPKRQENNPELTTNNYIPSNHQPILV